MCFRVRYGCLHLRNHKLCLLQSTPCLPVQPSVKCIFRWGTEKRFADLTLDAWFGIFFLPSQNGGSANLGTKSPKPSQDRCSSRCRQGLWGVSREDCHDSLENWSPKGSFDRQRSPNLRTLWRLKVWNAYFPASIWEALGRSLCHGVNLAVPFAKASSTNRFS